MKSLARRDVRAVFLGSFLAWSAVFLPAVRADAAFDANAVTNLSVNANGDNLVPDQKFVANFSGATVASASSVTTDGALSVSATAGTQGFFDTFTVLPGTLGNYGRAFATASTTSTGLRGFPSASSQLRYFVELVQTGSAPPSTLIPVHVSYRLHLSKTATATGDASIQTFLAFTLTSLGSASFSQQITTATAVSDTILMQLTAGDIVQINLGAACAAAFQDTGSASCSAFADPTFVIAPSTYSGAFELRFSPNLPPPVVANQPPVAEAGVDRLVAEQSDVTLDGTASFDPDDDTLTYAWTQTQGTLVSLSDPTSAQPTFRAPLVNAVGETLTFRLEVDDGRAQAMDTVEVRVENVNHAPVAQAGSAQTVEEGSLVSLDGTNSNDPDSDALSYSWLQVGGGPVALSNAHIATPSFTAPQQSSHGSEILTFRLKVDDGLGGVATDEVAVTVVDVDAPPQCTLATAEPATLWPPNQKFVAVALSGITDPDNDQVVVVVTKVWQDESVTGGKDSEHDALRQGEALLLRADREGKGNGRVYHIDFTAHDSDGDTCSGTVTVCVPRSKSHETCVDGGPLYNSMP
jgi:hypothetical protein